MKSIISLLLMTSALVLSLTSCGDTGMDAFRTPECTTSTECPSEHACTQSRCTTLNR